MGLIPPKTSPTPPPANAYSLAISAWARGPGGFTANLNVLPVPQGPGHKFKVGDSIRIVGSIVTIGTGGNIDGDYTITSVSTETNTPQSIFVNVGGATAQGGANGRVARGGLMTGSDKSTLDTLVTTGQVNSDWNATSGAAQILNKPAIPAAPVNADWDSTTGLSQILNKPSIAQQIQPNWNATTGLGSILNKPTIPAAQVASDWNATTGVAQILNKPAIPAAPVNADWNSSSGLSQILNKPTIPAAPVNADWNSTSGLAQILNKPNLPSKVAFGPMIILRFANWGRGQTGYGPGNPPTGMSTLTPTSGNVVENFNPDIYHPRLFNGGQFFGVGRQYKLICAVRCDQIAFDGVHCQLRYFNGTTSQIIAGLMDFGGGNDGIDKKSYFATSDTLTAVDEWWTFVPFFGAFNGSNFARIQDCVVVAYLV